MRHTSAGARARHGADSAVAAVRRSFLQVRSDDYAISRVSSSSSICLVAFICRWRHSVLPMHFAVWLKYNLEMCMRKAPFLKFYDIRDSVLMALVTEKLLILFESMQITDVLKLSPSSSPSTAFPSTYGWHHFVIGDGGIGAQRGEYSFDNFSYYKGILVRISFQADASVTTNISCSVPKACEDDRCDQACIDHQPRGTEGEIVTQIRDVCKQLDALLHNDAEMELMNLILLSIPNDIYNYVDACTSAKDMWKRVERLMRGTIQNKVDKETRFTNEFDQFVAEPGEALVSVYNPCQNGNGLKLCYPKFVLKRLTGIKFDDLFDYLQQFEKLVNVSRAKKLEKSHDPLALVAHTGSSSRNTSSYYVTHPTSVVDYEDEYQQDDVHTNSEDPLTSAMLLLARAITQNFYTPTNNRLCTSSNTRNQAIIQGDNENIKEGTLWKRTFMLGIVQCKGFETRSVTSWNNIAVQKQDEADDIIFDSPNENVNSGIIEKDTHVPDLYLEKQRDKLDLDVKDYKRQNEELQKTHSILKRQMSENEDKYHDTVLDLEAKLKKNVDLILKLGNSLQGMFMLGPKPLSVYDQQLKHGLGYPNPYTLKQAISQCPKLYLASSLGNSEISLNVRDTEDTLDDASKSQQKVYEKMNDPIAVANKQNCWTIDYAQINALYKDFVPQKELSAEQKYFPSSFIPSDKNSNATPSIPASMPSESPLIIELDKIKNCFQRLSELIQKNCKRASIFYTSPEEIQLNDFCQDQLKPIVNELQFYFEFFKTLFQRDIKEMKDVFESTESELCELEKQNDFLKDQLLEVSLKHEVELSVLLNHECVDNSLHAEIEQLKKKSIEIQEGLQARIKILEKDVQRCEKQSVDFELKLQHEKEKHKWDSSFKNKNINPLDYSWISKMEKLEDENVSLDFMVQSLIKERDNVKLEYQKLFNSIKKTRSQTQTEMDELIAHVSEKTFAYGAIRAENQNFLITISELKTRLANVEKGMTVASSVRRPMNRDSHVKNIVLANSKKPSKKVAVYVKKNKQTDITSEKNVIDVDVANAPKAKTLLCVSCMQNVVQIVLWIVDSGCSKHMTGDRSLLKNSLRNSWAPFALEMIILQQSQAMVIIYRAISLFVMYIMLKALDIISLALDNFVMAI
ncbi:hypothetical protein Tco_0555550 [Tanacetum coccineum]